MGIFRIGPLVALFALGGCCLSVITGGTGNDKETSGGAGALTTGGGGSTTAGLGSSGGSTTARSSSSGGSTTAGSSSSGGSTTAGSSSSGGSTTGVADVGCSGVYCSPAYVCDPVDGICKCGGQICGSGNCDADSGACLSGCSTDGGSNSIAFLETVPGEATVLPTLVLNSACDISIATACESGAVQFTPLSSLLMSIGLGLYPNGQIEGVPTVATNGVPFEFEVEARTGTGEVAFQNFLLQVEGSNPP